MRGRGEGEIVRGIEGVGQMCQIQYSILCVQCTYIQYCRVGTVISNIHILTYEQQIRKITLFDGFRFLNLVQNLFLYEEKPLYLLRICQLPQVRSCLPTIVPVLEGKILNFFPSPSLSLTQCTCRSSDYLIQMNSCLPEQLLCGNLITNEENSCYLGTSTQFSLHVHHTYLNTAQNI